MIAGAIALELAAEIRPLLAGKPPEIQATALADLVSMFIVGHAPEIREEAIAMFFQAVMALVPINEAELFPDGSPWR
jgi:hypothetical protein